MVFFFAALRLCVIKNFWGLRHNATSTLPWEPQADEHVLTLIGLAPSGQ
jgi:hypothetical protein